MSIIAAIKKSLRAVFRKPLTTESTPKWMVYTDWFLKIVIFLSGVNQVIFGETGIGILTLFALGLIMVPQFFTRNKVRFIPLEIELFLFVMVFFQLVVGEANDWYTNVPYYDKFVHLLLPMLIGLIGFLLVYTLYYFGKLVAPIWVMVVIMILVSVGIGAIWEIAEYSSDELLYPNIPGWHHFQGSLTEDPLHDTMNDLIADTVGATIGALIGAWYISKAQEKHRVGELMTEIGAQYGVASPHDVDDVKTAYAKAEADRKMKALSKKKKPTKRTN